jgi:GNAT superfamily N-acetyltransferase
MNDRRARIGAHAMGAETEGPDHEGSGFVPGQAERMDARVRIRAASLLDIEGLRGMFARASSETIYRRFHIPYPEVPEWMLALMLDSDHYGKEALVAVAEEKIVGHAMYAGLGEGSEAEMAIVVEDRWQSIGVGKSLLLELVGRARRQGIETFVGEVLSTNQPMLGLATVFVGTHHTVEDDVYHLRMPLQTLESTAPRALRRAA